MIQIRINERIFLKDPDSSKLGRSIVETAIRMIDQVGFEQLTFKKIAEAIDSTEASVYRYFENKHKLLVYLVSWYWNWLEYQLVFSTNNVASAEQRLRIAIRVISQPHSEQDPLVPLDAAALHRIVVGESPKAYLSKEVDADNRDGYFQSYKRLCGRIAEIVREIDPQYPYPTSLVSTLIESAHNQTFFAQHLPRLTEITKGKESDITDFLVDTAFRVLGKRS